MYHAVMCGVQGVDPVAILVHLDGSGNKYLAIPWGALTGTPEENEAWIVSTLQNIFDVETLLADLPDGHPYKLVDPQLEYAFWDETETYLVERSVIVLSAPWNTSEFANGYYLSMRRVER